MPFTFIDNPDGLADLDQCLRSAVRVAIDTETPIDGPRARLLRVMSVATRDRNGNERSFVVDARDVAPTLLAPILAGVTADAWNANFDARVIDAAVWESDDTTSELRWWDAQLADALLFQGQSGVTWFHGLAWATEHYLGFEAEGKGTTQLSYTANDDLTPAQISYAAADAVETLWVADAIRAKITEAELDRICEIEQRARPFLDRMERSGLPFDWAGWEKELSGIETKRRAAVGELAMLTGGGQGTLFDAVVEPLWNPASDKQVREALNKWSADHVRSWFEARGDKPRALDDSDSVTATVLREIGGSLASALLDFRNYNKVLSTYGESIHEHLHDDGRLRPQYLQVVGTNTGRLASRNPNAQNFTPLMKPYLRPGSEERVFVYADLSQAELRYLAQVADDEPLRAAFARDDDVHVLTAASMFGFDPADLQSTDPDRLKHLRQIAKALNFGIAYGTGAAALGRSLTAEGAPTSTEEASRLLAQYRQTYPGTAAWAEARIAEIEALKDDAAAIDWTLSMRLAHGFNKVSSIRREFRRNRGRWPSAVEITEVHPLTQTKGFDDVLAEVRWLMNYSAPVALLQDQTPFTFASRTVAGRRQQFNLHLDRLLLVAAVDAVRSDNPALVQLRTRFAAEHSLTLEVDGVPVDDSIARIQFEDRSLRRRYIEEVRGAAGRDVAVKLLERAARERVSAMVNAWRNAPIQGGVADIMLAAYADLDSRLRNFPSARPVQTVHDSVVIECDRSDAIPLVHEVRQSLEQAMSQFCPDVVPKADVDVRTTLADADVLDLVSGA